MGPVPLFARPHGDLDRGAGLNTWRPVVAVHRRSTLAWTAELLDAVCDVDIDALPRPDREGHLSIEQIAAIATIALATFTLVGEAHACAD